MVHQLIVIGPTDMHALDKLFALHLGPRHQADPSGYHRRWSGTVRTHVLTSVTVHIPSPRDRLTVAVIAAIAGRHAGTGQISDTRRSQAIAGLIDAAAGRTDLLAYHAGICRGFACSLDGWQATINRLKAELCIEAGADREQTAGWEKIGRKRAENARRIPYTGGNTASSSTLAVPGA